MREDDALAARIGDELGKRALAPPETWVHAARGVRVISTFESGPDRVTPLLWRLIIVAETGESDEEDVLLVRARFGPGRMLEYDEQQTESGWQLTWTYRSN